MVHVIRRDIEADLIDIDVRGWKRVLHIIVRLFLSHRLQAVMLLRLSQMVGARWSLGGILIKWINMTINGCDIAWQAAIGPGLRLDHPSGVVVGPSVKIGESCTLMQGVTLGDNHGAPHLGNQVAIAPGAIVIGPITIGDGALIGANSVVTKSIPAGATAFGNPAEVRRLRSDPS